MPLPEWAAEPSRRRDVQAYERLDIVHVPFPGTGGAIQAVIGNQVGAMWGFLAGLIAHVRKRPLRALAVGGREAVGVARRADRRRKPACQVTSDILDRPLGPCGTAPEAIDVLWEGLSSAMREAPVREALSDGSSFAGKSDEFSAVIESDYAR